MTHKDNVKRAQAHQHHARQLSIPIGEPPTSAPAPDTVRPPPPTTAPAPPTTAPAPPPPTTVALPPPTTAPAPPPPTTAAPPPETIIPTLTTSVPNRTTTVLSTAVTPTSVAVVRSATTSAVLPVTTVSSARGASTIFNTILTRVSTSGTALGAGTTQTSDSGDGSPGAGTVVGAVAGALVGVVVLSGLIGYLFKAKFGKSKEEDEDDPFQKGNYRRESQMLPDDFDDGMSQVSGGSRSHRDLGRSDTMISGGAMSAGGGPRPPTFIQRHIYNTQPSPSFAPGQIVNPAYYGNTGFPTQESTAGDGGWAVAAQYHQQQPAQAGSVYSDNLSRQGTMRSEYTQHDAAYGGGAHSSNLHGVQEEEEDLPSRSGTPVNPNPQHAYYHHHDSRNTSTDQSSAGGPAMQSSIPYRGGAAAKVAGSRSRYSVRNGEYEDYAQHQPRRPVRDEDAYGGM